MARIRTVVRWSRLVLVAALCACGDEGGNLDGEGSTGSSSAGSSSAGASSGGAETTGPSAVSYRQDVAPIFAGRCTLCHHENSAIDIDIADPFSPPNGLVGSVNTWAVAYPEGGTPMLNVAPGDPEGSFLLDKIGDPSALDRDTAGAPMPLNLEPLTQQEKTDLRAWIAAGAADDAMFEETIRPIFGELTLGRRSGKCVWCHHGFEGGQPPNLLDPFDPEDGAVGVPGVFGPDRIVPGDPDASVLVRKVEATEPGMFGAPMPPRYEPLTPDEIDIVRAWIAQGAAE